MAIKRKTGGKVEIFDITTAQIDRQYKGIKEWRAALKAAESKTNPRRKKLYDLYEEILLDLHLTSVIGKRRMKITNTTLKFFNKDGKENEQITELTDTEAFGNMLNDIIDSRFWGHSLLWFNNIEEKKLDYKLIPRTNVSPERGIVLKRYSDQEGINYKDDLYSRFLLEAGKTSDLGLLVKVAPLVIYKKGNIADWALYCQLFGIPFREFQYEGNDAKLKNQLEKIAKDTVTAPYAVLPSSAKLVIHDKGSKASNSESFEKFANFADAQMSKGILHNTMTTDAAGGNYKGEVHEKSEKEVEKDDKKFIIRLLNEKLIPILSNFGFKVDGGKFKFEDKEQMSLKQRFELDKGLAELIQIDDDYFYDTYNVPKPKNKKDNKEDKDNKDSEKSKSNEKPKKEDTDKEENLNDGKTWFKHLLNFFSFKPRTKKK
jgi:phage gp29-like protein